ncbi:hypothetical protein [Clostridium drakei]|uniref:Uncharacterized protein n=1 Tax=Clostridium drakei TaxID=332101 RepID=A0A2U8DNA5_9CLOT|nr:hypothetical protein [Clostridium drakei]AWI04143.1 hypothetical protein B9W14_06415 [Clostridium drakei]
MILHTSNGFEYDSEEPKRLSFVLRYAGDNPKYNAARLEYKAKSLIKSKVIFRYKENITHGSAAFLYSSNVFLDKSNSERYLESDPPKSMELNCSTKIIKNPRPSFQLEKANTSRMLKPQLNNVIWKDKFYMLALGLRNLKIEKSKLLRRFIPQLWLESNIELKSFNSHITREDNIFLNNRYALLVNIQSSQSLECSKITDIWIKQFQVLDRKYSNVLNKSNALELGIISERLIFRVSNQFLQSSELRGLFKSFKFLLYSESLRYMDRAKCFLCLNRSNMKYMNRTNIKFGMKRNNLNSCNFRSIEKYMVFFHLHDIYRNQTKLLGCISSRLMDKSKFRLLSKPNSLNMLKAFESKGLNRINLFSILKNRFSKLLKYTPLVCITHTKNGRLISRVNKFRINKFKNIKFIKKENILTIGKINLAKFLGRFHLTRLCKLKNPKSVTKNILFPIYKKFNKALNKNNFNIYCDSQKGISKTNPFSMDLNNRINSLKVIKRWWVVPKGNDYDSKILPPDYDYENYPLIGSYGLGYKGTLSKDVDTQIESMKLKYINENNLAVPYDFIPQVYNQHPNIVNPYMEHDDRNVGLYEIPLAINIMMEMVNLVGLIVHHQASQLCYCTGQEAMWLIMEMLDDWLNMESTIEELNRLDVEEQYHRTYRWVRWEAEKVYFDDRASNRFTGLKAGGQLLANLIEYMKLHHFNIVPIWKDLSRMDYWRNQYNRDNTLGDDISLQLDKIKGKRHLNIEAQKLDRTLNESIPSEK